jgi:hypothetical protein
MRLAYSDIDRARTVFVWGSASRGGASAAKATARKKPVSPTKTEKKRKQVATP